MQKTCASVFTSASISVLQIFNLLLSVFAPKIHKGLALTHLNKEMYV